VNRRRRKAPTRGLVGRDLARVRFAGRGPSRLLPVLLVGGLAAGLSLAALRIDNLRLGYALGEALQDEKALLEERRVVSARLEELRNPARLAKLARERGLARAARIIELRHVDVAANGRP
jgi:hypothetical protein